MLELHIPRTRMFHEETSTFSYAGPAVLKLEHSLISLSKWESIHQIPFLSSDKNSRQIRDYVRCMSISGDIPEDILLALSSEHEQAIADYISSPQSATTFGDPPKKSGGQSETITSELIYYWMVAANIPMECERWHLNRLTSLIRICSIKNNKQQKVPAKEAALKNAALNKQRRMRMGSRG